MRDRDRKEMERECLCSQSAAKVALITKISHQNSEGINCETAVYFLGHIHDPRSVDCLGGRYQHRGVYSVGCSG